MDGVQMLPLSLPFLTYENLTIESVSYSALTASEVYRYRYVFIVILETIVFNSDIDDILTNLQQQWASFITGISIIIHNESLN